MEDTEIEARLQQLRTSMTTGFERLNKFIEEPFKEYAEAIAKLRAELQLLQTGNTTTSTTKVPPPSESDIIKKFEILEKAILDKAIILSPFIIYARFLFQLMQMSLGKHPKTPEDIAEFMKSEYGHSALIYLETAEKAIKSLYMPTLEASIKQVTDHIRESATIAPKPTQGDIDTEEPDLDQLDAGSSKEEESSEDTEDEST
jgi:hypothetical protein